MWFTKLIKQFFFWIDKIVYNFIPAIYDLLLDIARTSILTQADIADMADRIYKLLAIFMIFKVYTHVCNNLFCLYCQPSIGSKVYSG